MSVVSPGSIYIHPLHSCLNSQMSTIYLADAASGGCSELALVVITATSIAHIFTSYSVEVNVKALRTLLTKTKDAHRETVEEILPSLPNSYKSGPEFKDLPKASFLLSTYDEHSAPPRQKSSNVRLQQFKFKVEKF